MNLKTRLRSAAMRRFAAADTLAKLQKRARRSREKSGAAPTVHYFHQVDDPYSHLAVQKLDLLRARYTVRFEAHLVSMPDASYQGSAGHFSAWAHRDAVNVANDYGVVFRPRVDKPQEADVARANTMLAGLLDDDRFAEAAFEIGERLWSGDTFAEPADTSTGASAVARGNARRETLGHYQGAMFWFDGEWFWGVDRLRVLEARLQAEGLDGQSGPACVPEPEPETMNGPCSDDIVLEYFPSLRSPYTAIGHPRVLDMVRRTGVRVTVRPVMPMMMRSIPAPWAKQRYIITDAAREGRWYNCPFGRMVDPFGAPVKRAFELFPAADAHGSAMAFVTAYLQAAWFDGTDITRTAGLQAVADKAGIPWTVLGDAVGNTEWQAVLDDNLEQMLTEDLWGVPSFRVTGGNQPGSYACWGQDRIWRVENEIVRRS